MPIQVQFTFNDEKEFSDFVAKFLGSATTVAAKPPKVAEESKKPTLNQKIAAKAEKENKEPEVSEDQVEEETEKEDIDFEAVGDAILNVSRRKGRDAAVGVLAKFGYKKVDANMKASDYPLVYAECKKVLAE